MRGFISTGKPLVPTFCTEDYYDLSALGRVVCSAFDILAPTYSSTTKFKWMDWYGIVGDWMPDNPVGVRELKEHLLSGSWCEKHQSFIMYILPDEPCSGWRMIIYQDINEGRFFDDSLESKPYMFADCRIGFEREPAKEIVENLLRLGFAEQHE